MRFYELPEETQSEVKYFLEAFDSVYVTRYEDDKYHVSTGISLTNGGFKGSVWQIHAYEVFTPEERNANFKKCFGCDPFPPYV